jgi:type II secretory pathway pseudopilin PulG
MTGIHNDKMKAGFTLVETLVSVGIFMILVTIAVGGFVQALHTQGEVTQLISAQSNVSLGVEQMAREIRTGYLFCHFSGGTTSSPACDTPPLATCVQTDSGIPAEGSAPVKVINEETGEYDLPLWTCPALDFYNSNSEHVNYSLQNGVLMRSDSAENGGIAEPLTSNDVTVKYLSFRMVGNLEGDGWPPRITIFLGIAPSSSDPAITITTLNFETTVSARQIDCTAGGSC